MRNGLDRTGHETQRLDWAIERHRKGEAGPAERMIKEAVRDHPGFADCSLTVYAKGSYANNTNVRADSDVDVAVQCSNAIYSDAASGVAKPAGSPYR